MPSHLYGTLLCAAAALCWSSAGLLVRLLGTDAWTTSFWRSAFMAITLLAWLLLRHGAGAVAEFRRIGKSGLLLALSFSSTFIFFILALSYTTVANTVVIMSATPLFAGVAAWALLGERMNRGILAAMLVACAGIALMVSENLGSGSLIGDLLALGVAVTLATNVVVLRRGRAVNMIPALCLAGLISAAVALPFAAPASPSGGDMAILAGLGSVQLGLGLVLFSVGVRHVPVAAAGLLVLLETVLSPLWAWLGVGERPTDIALLGGAMVIGALAFEAWRGGRPAKAAAATAPIS